eukprot:2306382-Amphidinium_carterae.2
MASNPFCKGTLETLLQGVKLLQLLQFLTLLGPESRIAIVLRSSRRKSNLVKICSQKYACSELTGTRDHVFHHVRGGNTCLQPRHVGRQLGDSQY